jgi:hypothetical protein
MASAIKINTPIANSTQIAGGSTLVQWSTVDTDPDQFSIYLVNFVNWPPSYVPLALDVPTAAKAATVQIPCDTDPSWGYQINAINGTNVYVIYAQSSKFSVSPALSKCVASTPTPPSTCAAPSTVTVTVSNTGLPSNSSAPSSSPAVIPTPSSSHYTSPGTVPKTIGWSSGYSNPVTIDHVPTPKPSLGNGKGVVPGPVTSMEVFPPKPTATGVTVITTWVTVEC